MKNATRTVIAFFFTLVECLTSQISRDSYLRSTFDKVNKLKRFIRIADISNMTDIYDL